MGQVMFITASTPWGKGETFILEELRAMKSSGQDVLVVPRSPHKTVFHGKAQELIENSLYLPVINIRMVLFFLFTLFTKKKVWTVIKDIVVHSRTLKIFIKNFLFVPKGVFISYKCTSSSIRHIHVHWGSTTATMGYVISRLTDIPWSMTLHRWDIKENNMLGIKVSSSIFTRCISEDGKKDLLKLVDSSSASKVHVIFMGVWLPKEETDTNNVEFGKNTVIACPANLVEVKGHRYLIEACKLMKDRGMHDFSCILIGDGPLKEILAAQVERLGLKDNVVFMGRISHDKMMAMYSNKEIDMVVLPSIVIEGEAKEGIPVSLMEAMGYSVPVVSTNTGGIGELVKKGTGILVEERNPEQLAQIMEMLVHEQILRQEIGVAGRQRVAEQFDIVKNVATISQHMKSESGLAG